MAADQVTAGMPLYQCKSCEGKFPAQSFYASNNSKCKECVKKSVRKNRADNLDYYQSYDRKRYRECQHRKDASRASAKSEAGIAARKRSAERSKGTVERSARIAVGNAIRDGKMERGSSCFFCGGATRLHAHHHDYSKPLDIFWLCASCHGKLHTVNGDFHRRRPA